MQLTPLPVRAPVADYVMQADALLDAWNAGDPGAIAIARHKHPKFLDDTIKWLPKRLSDEQAREMPFEFADAQLTVARWYDFASWPRLVEHVEAVTRDSSPESRFEVAVDAVVGGDVAALAAMLEEHPDLVRARSTRVTHFDPPVHRATLLHYIAANGVEGYRQKTPPNAVEIAKTLLRAGAEVDAQADMYGHPSTTMDLLVSSSPPDAAGLQTALAETLLDSGAAIDGVGETTPLMIALAFGFRETAEMLARRGARVDSLAAAAGLGRVDVARERLPHASAEDRHRALALAAQHGHADMVRLLLDAGEDPNRYNPKANHGHSTPLHQAIAAGHEPVVRLLVERGARLDIEDTIYHGTPLGWAIYCNRPALAQYLRGRGAPE